ncbi:bifunctional diaminohydroxyphosphoribosylaminopyrimidine deaminase/5-amino-6-(5-phosphoribosylamino)uracil reductase RibD [Flavobacteriaceae bacterium]|nr:bifunctional diaminohydroxyphosphoribosylaminopyrimidine deaminase/5-amino-6-(5-phosphoribosylamino)uracil reductase RibD [Flavobacteriaceae bacterium]
MITHEHYIARCIEIARKGLGSTAPNPMVGCVIVVEDRIIAEGYTSPFGGAHAEVNAIKAVKNPSVLVNATLYVTLEPCAHFGKTPPCSDLIIAHKIPRVVIGCIDEHDKVCGKGISKLKAASCEVTVGVLEAQCKAHHKRFFTFHTKKRPYIILKWAESNDGFIAPLSKPETKPVWISNPLSRQLVHQWRAEEQAILVGANTVVQDNPSLTTREVKGPNAVRIVVDLKNSLADSYNVFNSEAKTIHLTSKEIDTHEPLAFQVCNALYRRDITSVIIEGGQKTLQSFIDEDLWDEARVFSSELNLVEGVKNPKIEGTLISEMAIGSDTLKIHIND